MKKLVIISAIFILSNCGNPPKGDSQTGNGSDSTGVVNPPVNDSTTHPSGVDNSSVISTDTAAINVQNSIKKLDSATKQK